MTITRRQLLKTGALLSGGLVVGFSLSGCGQASYPHTRTDAWQPNAWLQLLSNGQIIFQLDKLEMGQGVMTTLPTLLAEELDVDPRRLQIEFAGIHPDYKNPMMGSQITGGSTSVATTWESLREAGAKARYVLMEAAAKRWQVAVELCRTDDGVVHHDGSGRSLTYAELADDASEIPLPWTVQLKPTSEFRWLGKSLPRLDLHQKATGEAKFGIDTRPKGAATAVVVRCPHFGGRLMEYDDSAAKQVLGVQAIFPIVSGVAVVADGYWPARQAADKLTVQWDKGPLTGLSTEQIEADMEAAARDKERFSVHEEGDVEKGLAQAQSRIQASYHLPFLHHSTMEPQNCCAHVVGDRCEIWAPSQAPDILAGVVNDFTGIKMENITVHSTLMGGGFGRRGYPDYAGEAAIIAQKYGKPVQLLWSREDDLQHDFYRGTNYHEMEAAFVGGQVTSWRHNIVSSSMVSDYIPWITAAALPRWVPTHYARAIGRWTGDQLVETGYDPTTFEGAEIPYAVDHVQVNTIYHDPGVPVGFWRSVGNSYNAFVVEAFMDEVAHHQQQDPIALRRQLLDGQPRQIAVLDAVARLSGWSTGVDGKNATSGRGFAMHSCFGSFVAMVVEARVQQGQIYVDKVYASVDCGQILHPDIVVAQIESAVVYALTAALKPPVTLRDGAIAQSNFHDAPVLRIYECPEIVVELLDSQHEPTGVGEIGVPPLAPALANAVFAAGGQRLRRLPLQLNT